MRVTSGESEPERRRRTPLPLVSPRSTKEKKRAVRPSTRSPDEPEKIPRYSCVLGVREFMAVLAVIGPLGTLISLWVLPQGELMDQLPSMRARHMRNRGEGASRVIHLTMADNERKARFVLVVGVEKMTDTPGTEIGRILTKASYLAEGGAEASFTDIFAGIAQRYFQRYGDQSDALARMGDDNEPGLWESESRFVNETQDVGVHSWQFGTASPVAETGGLSLALDGYVVNRTQLASEVGVDDPSFSDARLLLELSD